MAVDKKSDYYNPPADYQDRDGNWKNFTYVDHDKKLSMKIMPSNEEIQDAKTQLKEYKEKKIAEILSLPAICAVMNKDDRNEEFVERNIEEKSVKWREEVVRNACMINVDLCRNLFNEVWYNTVGPSNVDKDITHENLVAGKWKEWI